VALPQVYVFKKKVRKRYSKLQGHRSHITALRILEVRQPQPEAAALAASTTAAAALTNVARLGVDHPQAALDMLGRKLSPHQLKVSRRSSRPAAAAAQTAAAGATQDGQDALAADQPGRQGSPHRGRRRFGPPAVLNATAGMSEAARSNAQ
jgi:hypothetical protein